MYHNIFTINGINLIHEKEDGGIIIELTEEEAGIASEKLEELINDYIRCFQGVKLDDCTLQGY